MFTDRIEHVVPPRKGRRHALRLIRDILAFEPQGRGTDIAGATEYLEQDAHAQGDHLSRLRFPRRSDRAAAQAARAASRRRRGDGRGSERADAARHRARAIRRSGDGRDARRRHQQPRRCGIGYDTAVRRRERPARSICCAGWRSTRSPCGRTAASWSRCCDSSARARRGCSDDARVSDARLRLRRWPRCRSRSRRAPRPHSSTERSKRVRRQDRGRVASDSVQIGDPFRVTIGIRAPLGATIEFPRRARFDRRGPVARSGERAHERRHVGRRAVRRLSRGGVGRRQAGDPPRRHHRASSAARRGAFRSPARRSS